MASLALKFGETADRLPAADDPTEKLQECVLLVEDSEEAMFLVQCALEEYGNGAYRLEWVDGLTGGIARLSKGGVDLVLLDLGLPDSEGAASYARVREAAPDVPVLVLTGDTREETESAVAARGVEDFLVKDEVSGSLLLQAIRSALYTNKRWKQQKTEAHKSTQKLYAAKHECDALCTLGTRLLKLNRNTSALACAKEIRGIADQYSTEEGANAQGRAELLSTLERLASEAVAEGHLALAEQFRRLQSLPTLPNQTIQQAAPQYSVPIKV
jgi:DNA-binding response OmpR family regulator